ncbi:MAG: prolyl-tRNA synthetase associated domain-containing protein [Casimicrobiaceae bacterium]
MPINAPATLDARLQALGIDCVRVDHPAVFTCDEATRVVPTLPGARTKNLFLRDRKGQRHLLVVVAQDKRVDLKQLGQMLDAKGLMLASDERLLRHLGVGAGSVSILALINDTDVAVELVVDADVWSAPAMLAHPLVNTATLVIDHDSILNFLQSTGHTARVVALPQSH